MFPLLIEYESRFRPMQYGSTYTPEENVLSWQFMAYWASLAANGTAGSGWTGAPTVAWPAYSLPNRHRSHLTRQLLTLDSGYKAANCDFWDAVIGYNMY